MNPRAAGSTSSPPSSITLTGPAARAKPSGNLPRPSHALTLISATATQWSHFWKMPRWEEAGWQNKHDDGATEKTRRIKGLEWELLRLRGFHKVAGIGDLATMEADWRSHTPGVEGKKNRKHFSHSFILGTNKTCLEGAVDALVVFEPFL